MLVDAHNAAFLRSVPQDVTLESPSFSPPPKRFEAGTQAIAEAIGLGAACDYLTDLGMHNVHQFELDLAG